MRYPLDRRQFLGTTAAASTALAANLAASPVVAATEPETWTGLPPAKIYKIYAGRTGDSYLTRPTEELARLEKYFASLEQKLGGVKFIGGDLVPPAKVEEVATKLKDADALFIVHLSGHGGDAPVLNKLVEVGLPTALFTQPFSGHGWMYFPHWHKEGRKIMLLPSSDWKEIDRAVGLLRVPAWMKQTRILAVDHPHGTAAACSAEQVKKKLGATLVTVPNAKVQEIFASIDPKAAEAEAREYWISKARKIVEPKIPEIIDSARMYLAIKKLMKQERAQAICSVRCMDTPAAASLSASSTTRAWSAPAKAISIRPLPCSFSTMPSACPGSSAIR